MTVATADTQGRPSARTVLLKAFDERGFVFYTHRTATRAVSCRPIRRPRCCSCGAACARPASVRIEGRVEQVADAEADAYFASRPRMSQIGAWASQQSKTLATREEFDARVAEVEARFEGKDVPRPDGWSGLRVVPDRIEFWYGAQFRLHERWCYEAGAEGRWSKRLLYP